METEKLFRITQDMAGCNGFNVKPFDQWPESLGYNLIDLVFEAAALPDGDIIEFVDGEENEILRIKEMYKLSTLNDFLNSVFDGELHKEISV